MLQLGPAIMWLKMILVLKCSIPNSDKCRQRGRNQVTSEWNLDHPFSWRVHDRQTAKITFWLPREWRLFLCQNHTFYWDTIENFEILIGQAYAYPRNLSCLLLNYRQQQVLQSKVPSTLSFTGSWVEITAPWKSSLKGLFHWSWLTYGRNGLWLNNAVRLKQNQWERWAS